MADYMEFTTLLMKLDLSLNHSQGTYIYIYIVLRRFLHNHGNIATDGSPKPGLCPTLLSGYQLTVLKPGSMRGQSVI